MPEILHNLLHNLCEISGRSSNERVKEQNHCGDANHMLTFRILARHQTVQFADSPPPNTPCSPFSLYPSNRRSLLEWWHKEKTQSGCIADPVRDTNWLVLSTLSTEPRVGKVWAKRLEGDSRGRRNCRHFYSLLAGTAAIIQPLSRLMQQP